jgi:hypothetical protein
LRNDHDCKVVREIQSKRVFDLTKYTHLLADPLSLKETKKESFLETVNYFPPKPKN